MRLFLFPSFQAQYYFMSQLSCHVLKTIVNVCKGFSGSLESSRLATMESMFCHNGLLTDFLNRPLKIVLEWSFRINSYKRPWWTYGQLIARNWNLEIVIIQLRPVNLACPVYSMSDFSVHTYICIRCKLTNLLKGSSLQSVCCGNRWEVVTGSLERLKVSRILLSNGVRGR
jgi:hypothetical protein